MTDHALLRWLQRVAGVGPSIAEVTPGGTVAAQIAYGLWLLDLDDAEARDLVCPPRLHAALQIGSCVVRAADRTLVAREGRVVTTLEPGAYA